MSIIYEDVNGSANSYMELEVVLEGLLTVTVKAGTFKVGCTNYDLLEDQTFTLDVMSHRCTLSAFLVQEKSSGVVALLVDDAKWGEGYKGSSRDPHTNLYRLLMADVPAGTTNLEDVKITVWRRKKPEEVSNG